jgi:hypothetical protein
MMMLMLLPPQSIRQITKLEREVRVLEMKMKKIPKDLLGRLSLVQTPQRPRQLLHRQLQASQLQVSH